MNVNDKSRKSDITIGIILVVVSIIILIPSIIALVLSLIYLFLECMKYLLTIGLVGAYGFGPILIACVLSGGCTALTIFLLIRGVRLVDSGKTKPMYK